MTPNVRIYASEAEAKKADAALAAAGFTERSLILPSENEGTAEQAVHRAIDAGTVPERSVRLAMRHLGEGRALVGVRAPYGRAVDAIKIMERGKTVDSDRLVRYSPSNPSPFSNAIGFPPLSSSKPTANLTRSGWSFSAMFGLGLLSRRAAPLSSMFGMGTLSKSQSGWRSSMGFPLLSRNASPLSSMFGMRTVSTSRGTTDRKWGFPLLSDNPAPLSSMFGIRTLVDDR